MGSCRGAHFDRIAVKIQCPVAQTARNFWHVNCILGIMEKVRKNYSKGIVRWMIGYLILLAGIEVLALIFPMLLQGITEIVQEGVYNAYPTGELIGKVIARVALVFGFIVLIMVVTLVAEFFVSKYVNSYSQNMRRELFNKLQKVSSEDIEKFGPGKVVPYVLNDAMWMRQYRRRILMALIFIPVTIFGSIFMMFRLSLFYSLIALGAVPIIALFYWINLRRMNKIVPPAVDAFDDYFTNIKEGISGAKDIRILGKADERADEFAKLVRVQRRQAMNTDMRNNFSASFHALLFAIVTVFLVIYGVHTSTDVEDLIILNTVLLYLARIQTGVHNIFVWFVEHIPRMRVTKKRIQEVYNLPEMPNQGGLTNVPRFHEPWLEFSEIEYIHPSGKKAITGFNLVLPYNTRIAIAGGIGSGKSVLSKLLLREEVPTSGEILLNGLDISSINRRFLRRELFSYCGPKAIFENATMRDNLKRLAPDTTDEQIMQIFADLDAMDFVDKFGDNFLDFVISEKSRLSDGTKNFLHIVRAVLKPASVYIFNQCFEHVNQRYISKLMAKLKRDKMTCLFFSYDVRVARACNKVYVLKGGKISGVGRHSELLNSNQDYKKFYASGLGTIVEEEKQIVLKEDSRPSAMDISVTVNSQGEGGI